MLRKDHLTVDDHDIDCAAQCLLCYDDEGMRGFVLKLLDKGCDNVKLIQQLADAYKEPMP